MYAMMFAAVSPVIDPSRPGGIDLVITVLRSFVVRPAQVFMKA